MQGGANNTSKLHLKQPKISECTTWCSYLIIISSHFFRFPHSSLSRGAYRKNRKRKHFKFGEIQPCLSMFSELVYLYLL